MSLLPRERRRVLLAAGGTPHQELLALFARDPLTNWETRAADSFSAARFVLQHTPCDVLVVHEDLCRREGPQALAWLSFHRETPVVFLGSTSEQFTRAYELGATVCLPRDMALAHPPLLDASMRQALYHGELRNLHERTHEQLLQTRRHVDRLVSMIWRITPQGTENCWLPQRYLLERLDEELARSRRHQLPFSIAVGELRTGGPRGSRGPGGEGSAQWASQYAEVTSELIVRAKRRCDIVGQYGPRGFLLLMVHTPREGSVVCCQRLQSYLENPSEAIVGPMSIRSYFGLASASDDVDTPQALLRAAEQSLEMARLEADACTVA
jgi:GGDEF domain-containing protein